MHRFHGATMNWIGQLGIGLYAIGMATSAYAATIHVSTTGADTNDGQGWATAKRTVGAGLAAATSGDQVWVAAGVYVERIALVNGVALYGGFVGDEPPAYDPALRDWSSHISVLDGNLAGNVVTAPAGVTPSARIDGFTIRNAGPPGSGIRCESSAPTVCHNTITGNGGGGILCVAASPIIANNAIIGSGYSGIDCTSAASPLILNNVVAGHLKWGISCGGSSPQIINNTITGNTGFGPLGGIHFNGSTALVANNIIAFNWKGIVSYESELVLSHNCVYNPGSDDYDGLSAGVGDISVDPLLPGDSHGDRHLQAGSPCIDAGLDDMVQPGWPDLDGAVRIYGDHVDMGADEFNGTTPPYAPRVVYVSLLGDDARDGFSWSQAKRTVQAGIDVAATFGGADVWVAAGVYEQTINLKAGVHLYGGFAGTKTQWDQRDWAANVTVLDGGGAGSVVTAKPTSYNPYNGLFTIDGFTIRNGSGTLSGNDGLGGGIYCWVCGPTISNNMITGNSASKGGGIYCRESSATIRNNTIAGNAAIGSGAGIYCVNSWPTISDNTITENSSGLPFAGNDGGGVYCEDSSPVISANAITWNTARVGGGIQCRECPAVTIVGNTITDNSADLPGGGVLCEGCSAAVIAHNVLSQNHGDMGGGVCCAGSDGVISNNLIVNNTADRYGGGILGSSSSSPLAIVGNTIVANTALMQGGGISCVSAEVFNNLVAFNSSGVYNPGAAPTTLRNNCVHNPDGPDYTNASPGVGDISVDPLFVDLLAGDYRLAAGSPCIDAGYNAGVPADVSVDLDGHARFLDDPATPDCPWAAGTCGSAPVVDMGAYEFMAGDYDRDSDVDAEDLAAFLDCVSGPSVRFSGDCLPADLDHDGDVDVSDFGVFQRCFRGAKEGASR